MRLGPEAERLLKSCRVSCGSRDNIAMYPLALRLRKVRVVKRLGDRDIDCTGDRLRNTSPLPI